MSLKRTRVDIQKAPDHHMLSILDCIPIESWCFEDAGPMVLVGVLVSPTDVGPLAPTPRPHHSLLWNSYCLAFPLCPESTPKPLSLWD